MAILTVIAVASAGCDYLPFMGASPLKVELKTSVQDTTGEYVTWDADDDSTDEETLVCNFPNAFLQMKVSGGPDDSFVRLKTGSRTTYQSDAAIDVIDSEDWTDEDLINLWQTLEFGSKETWPSDAWAWWSWGSQEALDGFLIEAKFEATKCPGGTCRTAETVSLSTEIMCNAPSGGSSAQLEKARSEASGSGSARILGIRP